MNLEKIPVIADNVKVQTACSSMSYSYIFDLWVIKNFQNEDLHFKKKIVNLY